VKRDPEGDCVGLVRKSREYVLGAERVPLLLLVEDNARGGVFNNVLLLLGAPELIDRTELVV
jgi:hypothetical protein